MTTPSARRRSSCRMRFFNRRPQLRNINTSTPFRRYGIDEENDSCIVLFISNSGTDRYSILRGLNALKPSGPPQSARGRGVTRYPHERTWTSPQLFCCCTWLHLHKGASDAEWVSALKKVRRLENYVDTGRPRPPDAGGA